MFRKLGSWFENRTGISKFTSLMLIEHIPGGARWRYVWGSCLSFVFIVQLITGIFLMTAYSPGNSTAWGSVFYIQYEMDFGWFIRGLHHYGSQTMVVLIGLHMLQVVIAGAHLPPREINWWLGLLLMAIVLGLSLTGYLLPWDQKGFWATQVATNIMETTPGIGPWLKQIVVGGPNFGTATLTRFFALHVAILPALLLILLVAHIALFRRWGVTYPKHTAEKKEGWFWPDQAFLDMLVSLAIFGVMIFLVLNGHAHEVKTPGANEEQEVSFYDDWAKAGRKGIGANLDAPADPADEYEARPEWYFLFLFQLLKYFEGNQEIIGTMVIPGAVALLLLLLPLFALGKKRNPRGPDSIPVLLAHGIGVIVVVALLTGVASLTCFALAADEPDPIPHALLYYVGQYILPLVAVVLLLHLGLVGLLPGGMARSVVSWAGIVVLAVLFVGTGGLIYAGLSHNIPDEVAEQVESKIQEKDQKKWQATLEKARHFQEGQELAGKKAKQAVQQAMFGLPPRGGPTVVRNDPKLQFERLFQKNCATCHSYGEYSKDPEFKTSEWKQFKDELAKGKKLDDLFSASDLHGFGKKEWNHEYLKDPGSPRFYGRSLKENGKPRFRTMARWVEGEAPFIAEELLLKENPGGTPTEEQIADKRNNDFGEIAAWLAALGNHEQGTNWQETPFKKGYTLFKAYDCMSCHPFENDWQGKAEGVTPSAPDLTGYGGSLWLHKMIRKPGHPALYGRDNVMPSFWPEGGPGVLIEKQEYAIELKNQYDIKEPNFALLSDIEIEMIVRHFIGDDRVVFGGQPITGVEKEKEK